MTAPAALPDVALPFKMPGSKRRTFGQILPHLPTPREGGGFVVPFFGTGADSRYLSAAGHRLRWLGDASPRIALIMTALRRYPAEVLAEVDRLQRELLGLFLESGDTTVASLAQRVWWRQLRDQVNERAVDLSPKAAARTIAVWRLSFNGLLRENRGGKLNGTCAIQEGLPRVRAFVDDTALADFARWLAEVPPIEHEDFRVLCGRATPDDVVYLDPPYSGAVTFRGFIAGRWDDLALIETCRDLSERGVPWAMSNSVVLGGLQPKGGPELQVFPVSRAGTVSSDGADRGAVDEVLVVCRSKQGGLWAGPSANVDRTNARLVRTVDAAPARAQDETKCNPTT